MVWKIKVFFLRLVEYILRWPYRLIQFFSWLFFIQPPHGKYVALRWLIGLVLKLIDLLPITVVFESILDVVKWNTRSMNDTEIKIAQSVFGKTINYSLVGLDTNSWPVKKGRALAYVSFHTINFFKSIPDTTLIHELTNIWQYRKHGSIYIMESLYAQRWGGGYNYGGKDALEKNIDKGLMAFNFEQQAEIVEDAYRSGFKDSFAGYVSEIKEAKSIGHRA